MGVCIAGQGIYRNGRSEGGERMGIICSLEK